jgi:transposase
VTLALLWEEYKSVYPDGYQYSQFCELYRRFSGKLKLWMRQEHRAGEKLFVDYAGDTVDVVNPKTGEVRAAQIFVAVLGASNYSYCEATWSQTLPDWIGSHERAFSFFGGVPELLIPDNLKSGVNNPCRYEPDLNPTYHDLAKHYGTAVIPARVRKPKDKAKVEGGVLVVQRWILARFRNRTFFSLDELNQAITELLEYLNNKPMQKLKRSRREQFERLDRPALKPLPLIPFPYAEWKTAKVNVDYHIELDGHYYSVPYQLARSGWRCASAPAPWNASIREKGWPATEEASKRAVTPPRPSTCPGDTGSISSGLPSVCLTGRPRPVRPARAWPGPS